MAILYLRNVPDDVSERLAVLAARAGLSVSAFAVRELSETARRADNPALLGALPDLGVAAADVVADVDSGRAAR
jgi:plasmid stability protein